MRRGDVDFGIGPVADVETLSFQPLLTEPLFALVPKLFQPDARETISLNDLAAFPLLQYHTSTVVDRILSRAAGSRGITLNVRLRCAQPHTLVTMAEAGVGAAVLTESVARQARSPAIWRLRIVDPELFETFGVVTRRGRPLTPEAARLSSLVGETLQKVNRRCPRDESLCS